MLRDFISLFFPKYCMACNNALVKGEHLICIRCDYEIPKTDSHLDKQNYVAIKFFGKIRLTDAVAYLKFSKSGKVQRLLHRLKYDNRPEIGELIGRKYGQELTACAFEKAYDIIVPVPLHKSKLRRRGYNQSTAFGKGLSETTGLLLRDDLLKRNVKTSTQTRKSRMERWKNVEHIFVVPDAAAVKDKRILLVDDVITTGATIESCAQELLDAGCASVGVAAIAAAR